MKRALWFCIIGLLCFAAVPYMAVAASSVSNNMTVSYPGGGYFGGCNDISLIWDGSQKTSVAASGQVSNAAITSTLSCKIQGAAWTAHDVAIYGPGTYTVYPACPAGSPGCGTGTPYTFTVGAGELGVHLLWNWNSSPNQDVVDIWKPNAVFAPSRMYTGAPGSNPADKVWDRMSKDFDSDGVNGKLLDGPFVGWGVNFNVMIPASGCTMNWSDGTSTAVPDGGSVYAYQASSVACGSSCAGQTRTCTNGSLSGTYTNKTCVVKTCNCTAPWGATVANGACVTAYMQPIISWPRANTCAPYSEQRCCSNGVLSGSWTSQTCQYVQTWVPVSNFVGSTGGASNQSCVEWLTAKGFGSYQRRGIDNVGGAHTGYCCYNENSNPFYDVEQHKAVSHYAMPSYTNGTKCSTDIFY